jgi:hypothetical protein
VHSPVTGLPRLAAASAIVIIAAGLTAGCTSSGSSAAKPTADSAPPSSAPTGGTHPLAQPASQAIQLAANDARDVNSYAATTTIRMTSKSRTSGSPDNVVMAGTIEQQLHPSLLAEADFSTFAAAGQALPGGMDEVITPNSVYVKLSLLTEVLHTGKPWVEVPVSELSQSTGLNLGSLFSQLQASSPLTQAQLLAGTTEVRTVGTGTVDGVPVTEYSGTYSTTVALARLPASVRGPLGQELRKAGIRSARFEVWLNSQHQVRKYVVTETGSAFAETVATTVTSVNQPVNVAVPTASQATALPASALVNAAS